jgi:hypothetical protein
MPIVANKECTVHNLKSIRSVMDSATSHREKLNNFIDERHVPWYTIRYMDKPLFSNNPNAWPENRPQDLDLYNNEVELPGATWNAYEYHHTEKSRDWFLGLGIIAATIAIISIIIGNWVFAIFILVAAFALALFAHRPPRIITIHLGMSGILVEKRLYEFKEIESFWVDVEENPAHPKIIFKSKKMFMPYILIPIGDMDPNDIADFLAELMPEVEHKEPLLHRLAEDFGF